MESREQRIATLATTLRSSGIAKSDSQARMMAEDMIGVEEHVQRDYEVEHARAHEYLQSAKNLGTPRQTIKPEPKVEPKPEAKAQARQEPSRKIEELYTSKTEISKTGQIAKRGPEAVYTDINFDGKTLNQAVTHDTHNSALESIKAQVSGQKITPIEDVKTKDIEMEDFELENVEPESTSSIGPTAAPTLSKELDDTDVQDDKIQYDKVQDNMFHDDVNVDESLISEVNESVNVQEQAVKEESKEQHEEESKEESAGTETIVEIHREEPRLDAQKLIDMMEEDGKLEEHTREIKEKPKDVKPKEAYEENNIDLGNVFNFGKR